MTTGELAAKVPGITLKGAANVQISGMTYDSRVASPGDIFCALKGAKTDGNRFIPVAMDKNVSAVLTADPALDLPVPVLYAENDRAAMTALAHLVWDDPTSKISLVGVTGTNGKTTICVLIQHLLNEAGFLAGRVGTLGISYRGQEEKLSLTTPESPDLLRLFDHLARDGASHAVMEVSSIAMPMGRVDGFKFDYALFTNLTQDHLDLHGDMEEYFLAKKMFFDMLEPDAWAIANLDSPYGKKILRDTRAKTLTFGFKEKADIRGELLSESQAGIQLQVSSSNASFIIDSPLVGRFNAENLLSASAFALCAGVSPDQIQTSLNHTPQVRGRMERINLPNGAMAVVDYCHTPDAIEAALDALQETTRNRLIVVVGAGGDRDRAKRPLMGSAASSLADLSIFTSDNPRTEDPEMIIDEIVTGAVGRYERIVDRKDAIRHALELADEGDTVLIAGKGHEDYQEINGVRHHLDDREEVEKYIESQGVLQ